MKLWFLGNEVEKVVDKIRYKQSEGERTRVTEGPGWRWDNGCEHRIYEDVAKYQLRCDRCGSFVNQERIVSAKTRGTVAGDLIGVRSLRLMLCR